ncbi:MAG TPA: biotin-dependent carboxyltransferase family protein [Chthoniobacterales bacterium]
MKLTVRHAGFITLVQDLGRIGFRRFGVSVGGALDPHAMRIANLLVENDEAAAGLEITLGGFRGHFDDHRLVAWCGGGFDVRIGSVSLPSGHAGAVEPGEELVVNPPKIGCRAWLAISGGIDLPKVLDSRSTDMRAEFGGLDGRALRAGDVIPLGRQPNGADDLAGLLRKDKVSTWSAPANWTSTARNSPTLRFVRGMNWDCFDPSAHEIFVQHAFAVSQDSNRMGARLEGPLLWRRDQADLISEAVAPGTVQVPPSAKPILLLGDCQTIGGYPKIAHVVTVDLATAAQLRAGDRVRFREISMPDAHRLLLQRERDFGLFRVGLEARAA